MHMHTHIYDKLVVSVSFVLALYVIASCLGFNGWVFDAIVLCCPENTIANA